VRNAPLPDRYGALSVSAFGEIESRKELSSLGNLSKESKNISENQPMLPSFCPFLMRSTKVTTSGSRWGRRF
jgi:hypothetical protein